MGNKLQFGFLISFCFFSLAFSANAVYQSELEKLLQKSDSLIACRNFEQALICFEQALVIAEQENDKGQKAIVYNETGSCLSAAGKWREAMGPFRKAIFYSRIVKDSSTLGSALNGLGIVHEYSGSYDSAFFFYEKALRIREVLKDTTSLATRIRYETEKKEQRILLLDKENQLKAGRLRMTRVITISVTLLSLVGALISVLILRAKNQRIEQMKLEILNYLMQLDQQQKNTGEEHSLGRLVDKYELTGREAEIMEHLANGFRNEEIAERMFISRNTVKFHIKNIFIKLDVQNRVQALQKI